jgi:nucleotide-binding universal stress UspA family protein
MAFRDLLVVVDSSSSIGDRIELAASLASEHDAHLACLYILPIPEPAHDPPITLVEQIIEACIHEERARAREVRVSFEAAVARWNIKGEWRTDGGLPTTEAATHARYADLVIVGQSSPGAQSPPMPPLRPEEIALSAGRPVLVVPHTGSFRRVGQRIVVAWNASREATRAANDALPLLTRADAVTVAVVDPDRKIISVHGDEPGADIALHLARHGVKAEVETVSTRGREPSAEILSIAARKGADLIVMGAYGHSRSLELILGGATRELLQQMTVPIFMSH